MKITLLSIMALFMAAATSQAVASKSDRYNFRVFLGDEPIGMHKVVMTNREQQQTIDIEASFKVKALFVNLFRYNHSNSETWNGRCLRGIDARTRVNGKKQFVKSMDGGKALKLSTHDGEKSIDGCIRTFAYWDPELLKSSKRLLNTQTGEIVASSIKSRGIEEIKLDSKTVKARRYTLAAGKDTIDLWYRVGDNRWVALESMTRIGKKLRYEAI